MGQFAAFIPAIIQGVQGASGAAGGAAGGAASAGELEVAAKQEELGAIQREGDRKARLAEVLASQNAAAGAKGVAAFEGSPLTILQEDVRKEQKATQRDIFQTRLSVMTKQARASLIRKQSEQKASFFRRSLVPFKKFQEPLGQKVSRNIKG